MSACAPVGVLQDARLVRDGKYRVGIGAAVFMPLAPDTYYAPDGPVANPNEDQDLQYIPLPSVIGWARFGFEDWVELQTSFTLPGFIIAVGPKLGLYGQEPGSPFALSIAADLDFSFIAIDVGGGATVLTSVMVADEVSLDLTCRVGTFPSLWRGLNVAPTLGVTIGRTEQVHLAVGGVIPTGIGEGTPGVWLGGGYSY